MVSPSLTPWVLPKPMVGTSPGTGMTARSV